MVVVVEGSVSGITGWRVEAILTVAVVLEPSLFSVTDAIRSMAGVVGTIKVANSRDTFFCFFSYCKWYDVDVSVAGVEVFVKGSD